MIVCDLCGDPDTLWEGGDFALCEEHCREVLRRGMASPEQAKAIEAALKDAEPEAQKRKEEKAGA